MLRWRSKERLNNQQRWSAIAYKLLINTCTHYIDEVLHLTHIRSILIKKSSLRNTDTTRIRPSKRLLGHDRNPVIVSWCASINGLSERRAYTPQEQTGWQPSGSIKIFCRTRKLTMIGCCGHQSPREQHSNRMREVTRKSYSGTRFESLTLRGGGTLLRTSPSRFSQRPNDTIQTITFILLFEQRVLAHSLII